MVPTFLIGGGWHADATVAVTVTAARPLVLETLRAHAPTGILVCGGLTPLYQRAVCADPSWLEYLRERHIPYAGFSAGAAIAARSATTTCAPCATPASTTARSSRSSPTSR